MDVKPGARQRLRNPWRASWSMVTIPGKLVAECYYPSGIGFRRKKEF
jgi:hypothetical protein